MPDSATPRLAMSGVSKRFGATLALDEVSFSVAPGEVHALVGENGAGKSTLMKALAGAIVPDAGRIELDGEVYTPRDPLHGRRSGVGMIYQELSLVPHLSVEENIVLGLEPTRGGVIRRGEMRRIAAEALKMFDHPEIRPEVRVGDLTVGAQQLVEIARSLALGCRVLVLDEPTSSLSLRDVERLFELIDHLRRKGQSVIYISHFLEEVTRISDRITVLRDGQTVGTRTTSDVTADDIVALMVGRQVENLYPRSPRTAGERVLELDGLAGIPKPTRASLTLHRGEVLGVAGLIGAGRTEMLRSIFGLDPVKSGQIRCGSYSGVAAPRQRWSQGLGFLSEDRKDEGLALELSLADNTTLSDLTRFGPAGLVNPAAQERATEQWIKELDVRCRSAGQKIASLSGGNQQKIALARLLQHDVDVLLLDEPTRGIDVASKALIYERIDALAAGPDPKAVLMVSSYLPELLGICDRIAVMCRGRLGEARPVEDWDQHSLMLAATGQDAEAHAA